MSNQASWDFTIYSILEKDDDQQRCKFETCGEDYMIVMQVWRDGGWSMNPLWLSAGNLFQRLHIA